MMLVRLDIIVKRMKEIFLLLEKHILMIPNRRYVQKIKDTKLVDVLEAYAY